VPVLCIVILGSYIYFTEGEMLSNLLNLLCIFQKRNAEKNTLATGSILIGS
jgi:hypothetical protein